MITESVVCLILHCSRCNIPFTDEDERPIAWAPEDLTDAFPADPDPSDDDVWPAMRDWHQFGDRVVCPECVYLDDDGVVCENPRPLPPAECDKVARAHATYAHAEQHVVDLGEVGWTILHPLSCRPNLFDCPVNAEHHRANTRLAAMYPADFARLLAEEQAAEGTHYYGGVVKLRHKVNHGWVPPASPLHSEETSDRYEDEIATAVRKADKAHRKAIKALERAELRLLESATQEAAREATEAVESIRAEVERRFLELRELEVQMQQGPSAGANRSGRGSVRNPLPKGTKL